jgi:hypothetical protein
LVPAASRLGGAASPLHQQPGGECNHDYPHRPRPYLNENTSVAGFPGDRSPVSVVSCRLESFLPE